MKQFFRAMLLACGLSFGCSKFSVIAPGEFTKDYANYLGQLIPGSKVEIVKDLELKVTSADNSDFTVFLDNAYDSYKQDPKSKDAVIKKFAAAALETINQQTTEVLDQSRIVAVVKDRAWLDDARQTLAAKGSDKEFKILHDDLNSELIILYAEDTPKNMRYLGPKELEAAHLDRAELRSLAVENLKRTIPKIERYGTNGLFMLTAGGDYEASLLVIDSIWPGIQKDVKGEIVVAIPTRDLLIVTGSEDVEGINKMKELVQKASSQGSYRLTTKLFVYRGGKFVEFQK